jgi:hypothetical protein
LRIEKVEDGEMEEIVKSESLEPLYPEYNTNPRVYYKNLHRFTRCFISGSVAVERDGISDCAQGATVTLIKDSEKRQATTDTFGDFKFDGLEQNSGIYHIEISYEDRGVKTLEVEVDKSVSLGTVWL